jgi:hypothetical protein
MKKENSPVAAELFDNSVKSEQPNSKSNISHPQEFLPNIPPEMQAHNQWVCWKLVPRGEGKATKLPINARTGQLASVTDPATWGGFDEAVAAVETWGCTGIGFVLSDADPFTIIDLDNCGGDEVARARQQKIVQSFSSYSEISPSGNGLHIVVKGSVPSGKRREKVEVYSSERYMTMTGNVHCGLPIAERQQLLDILWTDMGGTTSNVGVIVDELERERDETIIARSSAAKNGEKFKNLFAGKWTTLYPSQSEADQALINILGFYSKNSGQIARIFLMSELGQREKAHRTDYLTAMIRKAMDREIPLVKGVLDYTANFSARELSEPTPKTNVFSSTEFNKDSSAPSYIWHRVFQRGYLYTITGMWGAGKSALAITLAIHAALGLHLCGRGMVVAKVLVLCGENPDDVRLRVRATCEVFGIDPASLESRLFFTKLPFAIDDQVKRNEFIADAARIGPVDLLIIDTGPAHSSADDENDNRQAHALAIAIRALMEALGSPATVALMHPTKGATRETVGTSRGGGAFSGSVDALCGVWRHDNGVMEFFHCNKFRGPGYDPMFFELRRHEFVDLIDNFHEAAISVVAVPTDDKPKAKVSITGSNRIALNALGECRHAAIETPRAVMDSIAKCGGQALFPPFVVVPEALWRERCYEMGVSGGTQHAKATAFSRSRKTLVDLGLILTSADHYWLPEWATSPPPHS